MELVKGLKSLYYQAKIEKVDKIVTKGFEVTTMFKTRLPSIILFRIFLEAKISQRSIKAPKKLTQHAQQSVEEPGMYLYVSD